MGHTGASRKSPNDTPCEALNWKIQLANLCNPPSDTDDVTVVKSTLDDDDLHHELHTIATWADNYPSINLSKTQNMELFSTSASLCTYRLGTQELQTVDHIRLLGVTIDDSPGWNFHIANVISKCNQRFFMMCLLKRAGLSTKHLLLSYQANIRSIMEYCCALMTNLTVSELWKINRIQSRFCRLTRVECEPLSSHRQKALLTLR